MKKFSKLLLVVLAVVLLATTVFSTLGSATNSADETALIGKADALGINRLVEDFTGEDVLIQDNIVPGEEYETTSKVNTIDWIDRDAGTNKYGALATVDSKSGNRYLRLSYEKGYAASGATYRSGIGISDKQTFAKNDYLIYEWDMTTETKYPTNLTAFFLNTSSTSVGDKQEIFSFNATGDKLVVGEQEYDLGTAGTWHHFTVVISLIADGTDYRGSLGALYLDGEKIGEFEPVANKSRKHSLRLLLGYYAQEREAAYDNATICVDNVVSTSVPTGYKGTEADKLAPLFATENPVTKLSQIASDELVYNADYAVPVEPKVATFGADGERVFYKTFAEAYTAYKAGGFNWIELYESAEGAVDTPVVIKVGEGITFTDTNTTDAYPCVEATAADGSVYKTYTKSTATLNVRFFSALKGTDGATAPQLEVPFAVGVIPTIPAEFAPVQFVENTEDRTKVYEVTDKVEVYVGDVLQAEMPLVREAMVGQVTVDVYPVYELKDVAFEVLGTVDGVQTLQYYTQGSALSEAVKDAPDGALVTIRKNAGITSRLAVDGKTLSIDLAGKALYQAGGLAFSPIEVKNATLNLYSSVAGGVVYCGKDVAAETMISVVGDENSTVRVGFADDNAKDAYAGNLTVHTSTVVKVAAKANVTVYGTDVKVVNPATITYGIIELNGAKCTGANVTLENVVVYNSYRENNVIAYCAPGANNTVNFKNTTIYAPAKTEANGVGFVAVYGAFDNVDTQKVVLDGVAYHGTLSGTSVADTGAVVLSVNGTVEATALDKATLACPQGALFVNNNKTVDITNIKYVAGGAFANSMNGISGSAIPALCEYIAVGKTEADFCEVTWVFYYDEGVVKELWVPGVTPVYRGTIPVSPEALTYTFEGVTIDAIGEGATAVTIEAMEVADINLFGLLQNIEIIKGMDFILHIPANVPVVSVVVGGTTITKDQMTVNEDGYYVVNLGTFSIRDLAVAEYAFDINLKSARNNDLTVSSVANVLNYFKGVYEDETLKIAEQRMVTAFLKYVQSAGNYLGVDTKAIGELIAGKATNYYLIDGLADVGALRTAVKGVRMSLVEVPAFVFYLRETFSGTITVGGEEYTVVNGVANEKNYILYTPASYAELGNAVNVSFTGTLAGEEVAGTGAFALTNYLMGVREELGSTPNYILDLYQFFAIAKVVEDMRAEEEMPF